MPKAKVKPMKRSRSKTTHTLTGREYDAMTPRQRQEITDHLDSQTPEQREAESIPVTPAERARLMRIGRKLGRGRPKFGAKGVKIVSVSVEADLLSRADAYARELGLKRAELFTRGLQAILPSGAN
jgi:hypothetical protein